MVSKSFSLQSVLNFDDELNMSSSGDYAVKLNSTIVGRNNENPLITRENCKLSWKKFTQISADLYAEKQISYFLNLNRQTRLAKKCWLS